MRKSILAGRWPLLLFAGAFILALGACAPAAPAATPTANVSAIYTQAFQTFTVGEEATEQAATPAAPVASTTPAPTVGIPGTGGTASPNTGGSSAGPSASATAGVPSTGATAAVPNTGGTAVVPNTGGATSLPGSTSGNTQRCNNSTYVGDATIPDGTVVAPGQSIIKTWRIQNTGTCVWMPQYKLVFVSGTFMGTSSVALGTKVRPGTQAQVTVNLTAPATPGSYVGTYQLQDVRGRPFGGFFTIVITVS